MKITLTENQLRRYVDKKVKKFLAEQRRHMPPGMGSPQIPWSPPEEEPSWEEVYSRMSPEGQDEWSRASQSIGPEYATSGYDQGPATFSDVEPGSAADAPVSGPTLDPGPEAQKMRRTAYGQVVDLSDQFDSFGKAFAHAKNDLKQKYFYWDRGANDGRKYSVFSTGLKKAQRFDPKDLKSAMASFQDSPAGQDIYSGTLHGDDRFDQQMQAGLQGSGIEDEIVNQPTRPMYEGRRRKKRSAPKK